MNKNLVLIALALALTACGGGGGSDSGTGKVSFALADAPVDTADHVVITVDKVLLRRDGAADIAIDRFTIPSLNLTDADTFQIDLLDYRHGNRALIVNNLVVPAGSYSQLVLHVLDDNVNYSYVEVNGARTPIKLPSGDLKLGGFSVDTNGVYTYTLDFDLRKAMTYNPGPDRYILKPRGVRIVSDALAASLSGQVDSALFDPNTIPACAGKVDPTVGNVAYLYQGQALDPLKLADVYDPDLATGVPTGGINPYEATNVYQAQDGSWHYQFGFVPAGNYTLAFSCNAAGDYADTYDGISIPLPSDQLVQISLTAGQQKTCNLPASGGNCGL
jgi:hypothetical protein